MDERQVRNAVETLRLDTVATLKNLRKQIDRIETLPQEIVKELLHALRPVAFEVRELKTRLQAQYVVEFQLVAASRAVSPEMNFYRTPFDIRRLLHSRANLTVQGYDIMREGEALFFVILLETGTYTRPSANIFSVKSNGTLYKFLTRKEFPRRDEGQLPTEEEVRKFVSAGVRRRELSKLFRNKKRS